jgi:hypothetical protein
MMRRLILADLPIDVVRGKQRVEEGSRQARVDPLVDDAMIAILVARKAVRQEGSPVLELLVGDDDEWPARTGRAVSFELVEKLGKRAVEGLAFELDTSVDHVPALLLRLPCSPRTPEGRMGIGEDESGCRGYRDGDVVGKVLRPVEADEAVDTHVLVATGTRAEQGMAGYRLSSEAVHAVQDGAAGAA